LFRLCGGDILKSWYAQVSVRHSPPFG